MDDPNNRKVDKRKWCFVPGCTNTSIKTPEKIFLTVPNNMQRKKKWFRAVKRELKHVSIKTHFYCCEDHFKLEEDMENYLEYRLSKIKIRMKPNVVPHIFLWQSTKSSGPRQCSERRARKRVISELLQETARSSHVTKVVLNTVQKDDNMQDEIQTKTLKTTADFCCQANLIQYKSKGTQVYFPRKTK
ncbi:uncharacterized protein [Euwallacea similis]|uniref:uncharacterized protein n=1 Tax=Euwallacea similis TaxID=1736056 RepID=UPI00344E2885